MVYKANAGEADASFNARSERRTHRVDYVWPLDYNNNNTKSHQHQPTTTISIELNFGKYRIVTSRSMKMVLEMEMSKTYQYRKVMKPMLERKRRARINKCLDELKDIMVECLTQEGEHITRLEKADILELTVEHMKKLRAQKQLRLGSGSGSSAGQDAKLTIAESFRAGYVHAANEVSKTLAAVPGVTVDLGTQLMSHLGHRLNYLQVVVPTIPAIGLAAAPTTASLAHHAQFPSPCGSQTASSYFGLMSEQQQHSPALATVDTPPPSECGSSESGSCDSPAPSESAVGGPMWRPW